MQHVHEACDRILLLIEILFIKLLIQPYKQGIHMYEYKLEEKDKEHKQATKIKNQVSCCP